MNNCLIERDFGTLRDLNIKHHTQGTYFTIRKTTRHKGDTINSGWWAGNRYTCSKLYKGRSRAVDEMRQVKEKKSSIFSRFLSSVKWASFLFEEEGRLDGRKAGRKLDEVASVFLSVGGGLFKAGGLDALPFGGEGAGRSGILTTSWEDDDSGSGLGPGGGQEA